MPLPPAYSKRFAEGRNKNGPLLSQYEVPEGKVAVVRDFSGLLHNFEPEGCTIQLLGNHEETIFQAGYSPTNEEAQKYGESFHWEGRAVFYAGEHINVGSPAGNVDYYLSGYLLNAE